MPEDIESVYQQWCAFKSDPNFALIKSIVGSKPTFRGVDIATLEAHAKLQKAKMGDITWTDVQLQAHLAEWNAAIRDGNVIEITLRAAPKYPFPAGQAYVLELPDNNTVALTLSQALVVGNWMEERTSPRLRSEPAPRHDGKLDKDGDTKVQHGACFPGESGIYIMNKIAEGEVYLSAKQAISLLEWLKQEEAELQQLAEEQADG